MDSPTRYCPTPGSLSHSPPSSSPQTMPIMHPQHQQPNQQQHIHHSHQQQQHPAYYGHNQGHSNYPPPPQPHSGYYQHPTPVSGYYSQQQPQNNHVPITTESAPPVVTHPYQQPQSQQAAAAEWQQPVPQHYYHPQPPPSHPQQPSYPPASHSPYGYAQTQQQPMGQHLQQQQPPMHNNHIQQQQQQQPPPPPIPQGQHALMNLSRFVQQTSSPSPSPNNIPIVAPGGGQIINGNNVVSANNGNESHSPPRSITSPSGSCTNGQMIPVRLQTMGKGQARTKATMRKLAMLEQQNSGNPAMQSVTKPEPPSKKPEKAKSPRKKKTKVVEETITKTDVSKNIAAVIADLSTSTGVGVGADGDLSVTKKRRSRKPKDKEKDLATTTTTPTPTKSPRKNTKKTLQDQLPLREEVVNKPQRKPRKKKEILTMMTPLAPASLTPERQLPKESTPVKLSPRGRKKKSSSFSSESLPIIPNDSSEKEYTLQIPETNDLPINSVKVVQTFKPARVEKKSKAQQQAELQERKAILAEEVAMAQVLLDLKGGAPSPLKAPEVPRTVMINTEIVPQELKVDKPLDIVKEKKACTPKENKGSRRKRSVEVTDTVDAPVPVQLKRRKTVEKKVDPVDQGENSVQPNKRRKSIEKKEVPVDTGESPAQSKRRKSVEKKESSVEPLWNKSKPMKKEPKTPTKRKRSMEIGEEVSLAELKRQKIADAKEKRKSAEIVDKADMTSTPKVTKLSRSPKSVPPTKPFDVDLSFIPVAEPNEVSTIIKTPKTRKPKKMSKSPRVSLDAKPNSVSPVKSTTSITSVNEIHVETNNSNSLTMPKDIPVEEAFPVTKLASPALPVVNNLKTRKLRKKRNNVSLTFDSTDSIIREVSKSSSAPSPDLKVNDSATADSESLTSVVVVKKETISKKKKTSNTRSSLVSPPVKSESPSSHTNTDISPKPKIEIPLQLPKRRQLSFPFTSKRLRKKSVPKVEEKVPTIPKPEPFQLNPKPIPPPTVFVKSSPLGNGNEAGSSNADKREKRVGPSIRVDAGKVKFYRGSDEEDNETEAKLLKEKVPAQFDESVPWICVFCQLGPQCQRLGDLFGPYFVNNEGTPTPGKTPGKRETWMHEDCAVWAHNVLLIGPTLRGLDEAVYFADREKCNICGLIGATVGCLDRGCNKAVHVPCAKTNSWKMEISKMHSYCPDHK